VTETDQIHAPVEADARAEAVTLRVLLSLPATPLTVAELRLEVAGEESDFDVRDEFEGALRDLAAAGLLHRRGDLVLPSRAAQRFDQLLG
jgi:hypothetical protein